MTSKKHFDLTVNHKTPDRMVVDFGSTSVTGIHVLAVENFRKYYGLESRPIRVVDPYQMLGEVDSELVEIIGIDTVGASRASIEDHRMGTEGQDETRWEYIPGTGVYGVPYGTID